MTPKKKKALMVRRHISAPDWLWERLEATAKADGRSVTELVRRLIINHLRKEEPRLLGGSAPLPNARSVGHYKRARDSSPDHDE